MHTKQKRQGPRLDRRNAIKNIDYDAATSSSSSSSPSSFSFDSQSAHRTRSLDSLPLSERTSFRIEGIDGEFDRICRSLGLSGPEDFAIPAAAWEARKGYSPISYINSSRFRYCLPNSSSDSPENGLSERFEASVRISKEVKHENKHSTEVNNGVNLSKVEPTVLPVSSGGISGSMEGESGIKGVRPSVLAPPPVMSRLVVDNMSSTWDLFRDFAPSPRDNEELYVQVGVIRPSYEDDEENNGAVAERIVEEPEGNDNVLSQSSLDTSNGDNDDDGDGDDDSFIAGAEIYNISPNGSFRCNIGSWQKGDFLGSGSFGTVYEGFTEDGFFFAVKEVSLLDQGTQGKQSIFQLEQEISLLSQFQHENIVQYLGTDKDDGKLYIFLELVTKGSLASLYQKYHLRDSQVSVYTRQILNGLNYLHEKNVVHRDIKCANILVDASGSVKLADFGLAKASKLNDIKSCKGTPFWMAPEVVNNRKKQGYGRAADIWSLGCTVLEMLTRQIPYSHLEGMQAMFRIGRGEPPPIPKSLSGEAQDFILKCLQVNPDDRPTADQLRDHPFVKRPLSTFLTPPSPLCVAIPS